VRCYCCNRALSDYEATLRHPETFEFLDICSKCMPDTGISPVEGSITTSTDYSDDDYGDLFDFDDENIGDDV